MQTTYAAPTAWSILVLVAILTPICIAAEEIYTDFIKDNGKVNGYLRTRRDGLARFSGNYTKMQVPMEIAVNGPYKKKSSGQTEMMLWEQEINQSLSCLKGYDNGLCAKNYTWRKG